MTKHPLDYNHIRQNRKWADPRLALLLSSKASSVGKNREHTIVKEDIEIPTHCPVLGLKLKTKGRDSNSMTLDRIDTGKGYVPGNIKVISWRANRLKSDASLEELEKIVNYMKKELTSSLK